MPVDSVSFAPMNLLIFVSDPTATDVPMQGEAQTIRSTEECITIPCLYWDEGDTKVSIGPFSEIAESRIPDFDGVIKTPTRRVVVTDVAITEYLGQYVAGPETRVRVWTNHPTSPDEIKIAIGD